MLGEVSSRSRSRLSSEELVVMPSGTEFLPRKVFEVSVSSRERLNSEELVAMPTGM
jgi:hypothetical protein